MTLLLAEPVAEIDRLEMALYDSAMNPTATIRVPVLTRDMLADVAKWKGQSLASYVNDLAKKEWRIAVLQSEHEAAVADESNPEAVAEYELYDSTVGDDLEWL